MQKYGSTDVSDRLTQNLCVWHIYFCKKELFSRKLLPKLWSNTHKNLSWYLRGAIIHHPWFHCARQSCIHITTSLSFNLISFIKHLLFLVVIMNRLLLRSATRTHSFGKSSVSNVYRNKFNNQLLRQVHNSNYGSDSTDRQVKAKLTLEDGSVFEGWEILYY